MLWYSSRGRYDHIHVRLWDNTMYWPALTGYLLQACKKCKVKTKCVDEGGSCPKWARSGYCYSSQYKKYMKLKCKKSCKLCWIIYLYIFEDKGLNWNQDGPQGFIIILHPYNDLKHENRRRLSLPLGSIHRQLFVKTFSASTNQELESCYWRTQIFAEL